MRLSVSDLDTMAWYFKSDQPLEELLNRLNRLEPPNEKMLIGTAFHSVLEKQVDGKEKDNPFYSHDGYTFEVCFDGAISENDLHEVSFAVDVPVPGAPPVTLAGRVDGISGNRIIEYKTTGDVNMERYFESWQWRAYLFANPFANHVQYDVFVLQSPDKHNGVIRVDDQVSLTLSRYPSLNADVVEFVSKCAELLERAGWQGRPRREEVSA